MGFTNTFLGVDEPEPTPKTVEKVIKPVKVDEPKKMGRLMKAASIALGLTSTYGSRGAIFQSSYEAAPYDFDKIIQAVDTDSYVKRAFAAYQELMWKEGFDIKGENTEAVEYLYERFDFMEITMGQPIAEFFKSVTDQLCKFHNAIIAEVRNDKFKAVFPGKLKASNFKGPIVGYEVIPVETVRIKRDAHNKPLKYMQELDGYGAYNQPKAPEWDASEIIHFVIDRKPGYIFGTPFMTAAMEDIIALRTMEEDVQNLVHQELFPIVDVTVGTPEYPGDDEEVMQAADEIDSMRHDGALIHTERRAIEIIGSEGAALDATNYLNAAQQRVAIGLGLYPHHLGMMFAGGNRDMTSQLDIALYDRVKTYQRYAAAMIGIFIINPLLREGGFNPMVNPINKGKSDRCVFRFREIDNDTRIKKETHEINKFTNNLQTIEETRLALGLAPEMDESGTLAALTVRLQPDQLVPGEPAKPGTAGTAGKKGTPPTPGKPPTQVDTTPAAARRGDAATPSKGGAPNPKNTTRGTGNQMRPQNQHGRSLSPNLRHSDDSVVWLEVAELLSTFEEENE